MEKLYQQSATNKHEEEINSDHEWQIGTTLKDFLHICPDSIFKLHYNIMGNFILTEDQFDLIRRVYDKNFKESDSTFVYQLFQNLLYIKNT